MLLSRHQNAGQNYDIKVADSSFDNVAQFRYLGTTTTNQNLIQEEIKRRLNSGNDLLSSRLLSKNIKIRIYKTIILAVILYGCEAWSLTLREEYRLGVFGSEKDEVRGNWRKLHNGELHNLYSSPNIVRTTKSRRMRWAGQVSRVGEKRNACRILVGKPEGKRPLRRPRRRLVDNIIIDLRETGCYGMDWIELAQNREQWRALVNTLMNLRVP
jgi:hypothetical protein